MASPYYKTRKEQKSAVRDENVSTAAGVGGLGASLASKHKLSGKAALRATKAGRGLGAASVIAAGVAAHHVVKRDKLTHQSKKTIHKDVAKAATGWSVQPPHPSNPPQRTRGNKGSH